MSVIVGSARIDENGNARGGKAGDQTGREVSTQNWYLHSKGWRVFRPMDKEVGEKIAYDMKAACDNQHIGYDQGQRLTLYNIAREVGFDCAKIKTNCETDCSALVRVALAYARIDVPNFTTSNEAKVLMSTGKFIELKDDKYTKNGEYLRRGDILVTKTQGHTVVVVSDGKYANIEPSEIENFKMVLVTGGSVYIRENVGSKAKPLGIVYKNTSLPYLDETKNASDDRPWYKVKYGSRTGWISSKYTVLR